jgi:hypothetical protein
VVALLNRIGLLNVAHGWAEVIWIA